MKWLMIVLTAIFVMAKLINVITWSWWLVLIPVWIYLGVYLLVFLVYFIIAMIEDV